MTAPFADIAVALKLEATVCAYRLSASEVLAARIGLPALSTDLALADPRLQARLVADAHAIFNALIPHERAVRALLGVDDAG